jgi:hypothetical protein
VGNIEVVVPSPEFQSAVADQIRRSIAERERSQTLANEAEALLLAELGLDRLDLSYQATYAAQFSAAWAAGRLDAEYFQPKYGRIRTAIQNGKHPTQKLGSLIHPIRNGFDYREFTDKGTPYIRVGDVKKGRVDLVGAAKIPITIDDVGKDVGLRPGDVLLTRKGTFGNAAVVRQGQEHAIISSEIMLLRPKNPYVQPDYLALFLNSPAGYLQIEQRVHGVAFYSISQPDLAEVEIPVPGGAVQQHLGDLVAQAILAEIAAHRLLEEAKRRVEEMVLGENKAPLCG